MSRWDDLDEHLAVLVRLRRHAGVCVYARAPLAAKIAVARVILAEAERRPRVSDRKPKEKIVRFPAGRAKDARAKS